MATPKNNKSEQLLNDAIKQIEKQYGKGSIMKLGDRAAVDVDAISSGSLAIEVALGVGGYPKGRIIEIYGPESSGKTTLALHAIAEVQKSGGKAAFIDAENAKKQAEQAEDSKTTLGDANSKLQELKDKMSGK